jgi:hypothetical protein
MLLETALLGASLIWPNGWYMELFTWDKHDHALPTMYLQEESYEGCVAHTHIVFPQQNKKEYKHIKLTCCFGIEGREGDCKTIYDVHH